MYISRKIRASPNSATACKGKRFVGIGLLGSAQVGPRTDYESVGRVFETRWAHHSDHPLGPPLALRSFPLADASMGPNSPRPGSEADLGRCGTP